jgi:hypothetical protein
VDVLSRESFQPVELDGLRLIGTLDAGSAEVGRADAMANESFMLPDCFTSEPLS